jgi:hypothetical protein
MVKAMDTLLGCFALVVGSAVLTKCLGHFIESDVDNSFFKLVPFNKQERFGNIFSCDIVRVYVCLVCVRVPRSL